MKVWSTLALLTGVSTAASILTPDSVDGVHAHSGSSDIVPVLVPEDAPADYHTAVGSLTESHSTGELAKVPNAMIDRSTPVQQLRRREASRKPRGDVSANDFYECATTGNPPRAADCNVVISNVLAANQATVIAPGACLLFQFSTCWGFFCSLCERLGTDTNFIASQLTNAQTLCVSGGAAGTVVGEDAPQWEAGFIRANGALPNYAGDVC
ncbi:hypothetical protein ANO14919_047380 [Xylariales sp. No.14919]|nr:hypothetical protein ANO14919_047380 [Xylariales sp. No.14919]